MITIEPIIKIYDDEGNLSRAYDKAVDKMIDKTYDIDLEQFDFDEVAKGKSKELDNLVAKLCKESGLGSKDIYTMLLDRFEAEYDVLVDFVVYLGDDWEESKKSTRKSLKESDRFDDLKRDIETLLLDDKVLKSLDGIDDDLELAYMLAERLDPSDYSMNNEDDLADEIKDMIVRGKIKITESKKSARKSLKEYKLEFTEDLLKLFDKNQDMFWFSLQELLVLRQKEMDEKFLNNMSVALLQR